MRRTLWMTVTLVLVVGWLLVSYLPGLLPQMPALEYPAWSLKIMAATLAAGAAGFLLIQLWIVRATDKSLVAASSTARAFHLRRGAEAFWTTLPLVMTLLLIAAVWLLRQPGA